MNRRDFLQNSLVLGLGIPAVKLPNIYGWKTPEKHAVMYSYSPAGIQRAIFDKGEILNRETFLGDWVNIGESDRACQCQVRIGKAYIAPEDAVAVYNLFRPEERIKIHGVCNFSEVFGFNYWRRKVNDQWEEWALNGTRGYKSQTLYIYNPAWHQHSCWVYFYRRKDYLVKGRSRMEMDGLA